VGILLPFLGLNKYIFESLDEVQNITDDWLYEYNHERPHSSLGGLPPKVFVKRLRLEKL
jgi:putative transposase